MFLKSYARNVGLVIDIQRIEMFISLVIIPVWYAKKVSQNLDYVEKGAVCSLFYILF